MVVSTDVVGFDPELAALEEEIHLAGELASLENAALAAEHHRDAMDERLAGGGDEPSDGVETLEEVESEVSVPDSFEHVSDDLSVTSVPMSKTDAFSNVEYNRDVHLNSAWNSLQSPTIKHFWENDFWSDLLSSDASVLPGVFNFNRFFNRLQSDRGA